MERLKSFQILEKYMAYTTVHKQLIQASLERERALRKGIYLTNRGLNRETISLAQYGHSATDLKRSLIKLERTYRKLVRKLTKDEVELFNYIQSWSKA